MTHERLCGPQRQPCPSPWRCGPTFCHFEDTDLAHNSAAEAFYGQDYELPVVMLGSPADWLKDLLHTVIYIAGSVLLGVLLLAVLVWVTGLNRFIFFV